MSAMLTLIARSRYKYDWPTTTIAFLEPATSIGLAMLAISNEWMAARDESCCLKNQDEVSEKRCNEKHPQEVVLSDVSPSSTL